MLSLSWLILHLSALIKFVFSNNRDKSPSPWHEKSAFLITAGHLECTQSQFSCSSWESRRSWKTPTGAAMSKGPTPSADRFRSSQSMLSIPAPCRFNEEGSELSLKPISIATSGEPERASVPPSRDWEDRSAKPGPAPSDAAGSRATWTRGGGRDRAVLMGRVVTLAVTGRGLSWHVASCLKGEISGEDSENRTFKDRRGQRLKTSASPHLRFWLAHQTGRPFAGWRQWDPGEGERRQRSQSLDPPLIGFATLIKRTLTWTADCRVRVCFTASS